MADSTNIPAGVTTYGLQLGNPASLAGAQRTFFEKKLLKTVKENLVLASMAQKYVIPSRSGAKSVTMWRWADTSIVDAGNPSAGVDNSVQTLTEGTLLQEAAEINLESVVVEVSFYGRKILIWDQVEAVSMFDMVSRATEDQGQAAALHFDALARTELAKSADETSSASKVDYRNKVFKYSGHTTFSGVYNSGTYAADYIISEKSFLDAMTGLKLNKADTFGGNYMAVPGYMAVAGPQICRDLMNNDTLWQRIGQYQDKEIIYKGEVGKLFGCKIIETSQPMRANSQGTYLAAGKVFSTFVFGKNAFGVATMDYNGTNPDNPAVNVIRGPDKYDPLGQIAAIVGFKTAYACRVLQPKHIAEIYAQTGYGND